ncbi:uncharacterized protein NDAI_0A02430 [Naumovozyma dairenensis CBS 421]|uniref:LCCL domain-containing protein n=1 Tax=Naumovozyma dairenensis (strain ATCC 10597 / BCRC 20456 / CBS 421 / NBRC 0211 / NRRL Y-12639) TaxID=1071378 RepID=G0W3L3_NAUDC|nr:hypothetical protein NDAI_0A02430 [Naumovozyma dairenensis CBS 421]CCD22401.1 hypothetical protein NDAI_0A02430 [Naumovozyma dairenensis CBS 421]
MTDSIPRRSDSFELDSLPPATPTNRDSENIPLQDFSENKPLGLNSDENAREQWLLLEDSNMFKRFFKRVWNGPIHPADDPPSFPEKWQITKKINNWPEEVFNKRFPKKSTRILILIVYCALWFGTLFLLIHPYLIRPPYFYPDDGKEKIPILSLSCNSYLDWEGTNNACGINAGACGPFDNREYMIRCPAFCDRGGWTYSAIAVGNKRIKYTGYKIGGGPLGHSEDHNKLSYPYRADSFPCAAAVHAGLISPVVGGCARLSKDGRQYRFPSRLGKYGTGLSVAFNSFFPSSFSFREISNGIATGCYDPRIAVVTLSVIFGLPLFYIYDSIYGYWVLTIVAYWVIALALDPPMLTDAHDIASVYELFSLGFQRLFPLCFLLYVGWKSAVKRTLENGSPLAKIILWYPTFWLGVMNNITFDRLPVDRLTAKDLKEQAGAATAVGSIAATILICAIIQAYSLWKSGRFRKFFKIYISFISGLIFLASIPGLNLRIHHYILGAVLLPGCATRGSSAYLFQGVLVGLILSGVSRWDFASIVETDVALLRGEGGGRLEPPTFNFNTGTPHMISWSLNDTTTEKDLTGSINGYSLLLNDFEVYLGTNSTISLDVLKAENSLLNNLMEEAILSSNGTIDLYLRVARASMRNSGELRGDYTNGAILSWPEGVWTDPEPGVS